MDGEEGRWGGRFEDGWRRAIGHVYSIEIEQTNTNRTSRDPWLMADSI